MNIPAHKNTEHPAGQVVNHLGVVSPVHQVKDLASEISDFHLNVEPKAKWPLYGSEDVITMSRSELLILLVKLDEPESAAGLIRTSESGKKYRIQAIEDTSPSDILHLHPRDVAKVLLLNKVIKGE